MKRLASLILATALFATPMLHADQKGPGQAAGGASTGSAAQATSWGIGIAGVAVVATVAAVAAANAGKNQGSFNH